MAPAAEPMAGLLTFVAYICINVNNLASCSLLITNRGAGGRAVLH